MNGSSSTLLALLVTLGSLGLAGCIEAPEFLTAASTDATAFDLMPGVAVEAAAWDEAAELVFVGTLEAPEWLADEQDLPADSNIGDGRAMTWFYGFITADSAALFRADADGNITLLEESSDLEDFETSEVTPISNWTIDSDAAMGAAREDAMFRKAVAHPEAAVALGVVDPHNYAMMAMAEHEHDSDEADANASSDAGSNRSKQEMMMEALPETAWGITVFSPDGFIIALVDASNGELIDVLDLREVDFDDFGPDASAFSDWDFAPGTPVHIDESGRFEGVSSDTAAAFPFTLDADGMVGTFAVTAVFDRPGESMHWVILDSEGNAVDDGMLGVYRGRAFEDADGADVALPAGDYVLELHYTTQPATPLSGLNWGVHLDIVPGDMEFGWEDYADYEPEDGGRADA